MAVVQHNAGNTGTLTPASTDATLPVGTTAGNTVLLIVSADATVATPSGFVLDRSQVNNNGHYVFRRAAAGAGETSWTITPSSSASVAWAVLELSALTASPLDGVASEGAGFGVSSRGTGTTGVTAQADELAVASIGLSIGGGSSNSVSSWSDSFAELRDTITTKASGTNVGVAVAVRTLTATGAYTSTATLAGISAATGIITTYKTAAGQAVDVGQALEADTAQPVSPVRAAALGQALESDAAHAVTAVRVLDVGQAAELDTGLPIAAVRVAELGRATQLDEALPITPVRVVRLGQAGEIDTALVLTPDGPAPAASRGRLVSGTRAAPSITARSRRVPTIKGE